MTDRIELSESTQADYSAGLINSISAGDWNKSARTSTSQDTSSQACEMLKSCPLDITIYSGDSSSSGRSIQDGASDQGFQKTGALVEMTEPDREYARVLRDARQKATDIVERNMTPAEMKQLREDMQKYKPAYEAWETQVKHWAGLNPPPQPEKPASWVKYQNAVKEQMNKLLKPEDRSSEPFAPKALGPNQSGLAGQDTASAIPGDEETWRVDANLEESSVNPTDSSAKSSNTYRELLVQTDPNEQSRRDPEKEDLANEDQMEGMPGVQVTTNDEYKIGITARREKFDLEQHESAPPSSTENLQFRYISRQEKYRSEQVIRE